MAGKPLNDDLQEVLTITVISGVDGMTTHSLLNPETLVDCTNFLPDQGYGGLTLALGRSDIPHVGPTVLPGPCFGIALFRRFNPFTNRPPIYIFAIDYGGVGTLWIAAADGSQPLTQLPAPPLTPSQPTYFAEAGVWMFMTNGTDMPLKIDNDLLITSWGIVAPATAPTLAGAPGGNLSFDQAPYYYCTTFGHTQTGVTDPGLESSQGAIAGPYTLKSTTGSGTIKFGEAPANSWPGAGLAPLPVTYAFQFYLLVHGAAFQYGNAYQANSNGSDTLNASSVAGNINAASGIAYTTPAGDTGVLTVTATIDSGDPKQVHLSVADSTGSAFAIGGSFVQFAVADNQAPGGAYVTPLLSAPGTISGGANESAIALSAIPVSTDPQVNERNIYRLGGGLGQWRLVTTIHDNTTTTYTDVTADTKLTGQSLVVFRDDPPPFSYICSHQQRIFGFNTQHAPLGNPGARNDASSLWWSNYTEPWGFNSLANILTVGESLEGDGGQALASLGTVLGLWKKRTFYALFGNSDATWASGLYKIADIDCASPRSVCAQYGMAGWVSRQGAYVWSGSGLPENISDGKTGVSNIRNVFNTMSQQQLRNVTGFWYNRMIGFSFPHMGRTYMYDPKTGWWPLPYTIDHGAIFYDPSDDVPVVAVTDSRVDAWFQTATDLGYPVVATGVSRTANDPSPKWSKTLTHLLVDAPEIPGGLFTYQITADAGPNEKVWPDNPFMTAAQVALDTGYPRHRVETDQIVFVDLSISFTLTAPSTPARLSGIRVYAALDRILAQEAQADQ